MPFDGIVTKTVVSELNLLSGARIDKIFEPNSNTVILGFYLDGYNYALNICCNPQNYRINLTTNIRKNPKVAPNFCMVLRKHLIGMRIKNIFTNSLERIVTIEFEGFDDIDDIISKKLVIELMGKHCNIILLDEQNVIIDCLRHINNENATHIVIPHIKYVYPKITKKDFLSTSLVDFENTISSFIKNNKDNKDILKDILPKIISDNYNGISKKYISYILEKNNFKNIEDIYNYLNDIINRTNSLKLKLDITDNDFFLVPDDNNSENFTINFALDDFYYKKETSEELKTSRDSVLRLILYTLKKYNNRLENINNKLKNCENMDKYRLYGELITANLYKIPNKNLSEIELENYYDNNNKITIPLDKKYLPSINAKRYFKKYNKLKNALNIVSIQKEDTIKELDYIESVVYELEEATSIEEIAEILDEISENDIFKEKTKNLKSKKQEKVKKSNLTKNKNTSFNPLKYTISGFTLLVGRNNKENDYLTLKFAKKTDIWFHTKDIHGSHAVLVLNNNTPTEDILIKCAQITAYHSKARFSSNVAVDTCPVKYVKKPKNSKPGMVIYTNYKTLFVDPKDY